MESWQESFWATLPLFVVGAGCIAFAVYLYIVGASTNFGGDGSIHLRPWVLFVALGITGIGAGTVALWIEDAPTPPRESVKPSVVPEKSVPAPAKARTPPSPPVPRKGYPGPTVQELGTLSDRLRAASSTTPVLPGPTRSPAPPRRPAVSAAVWDEDLIGPDEAAPGHEEIWETDPSGSSAAVAERLAPDAVLHQLDEIEASLRRKTVAARTP